MFNRKKAYFFKVIILIVQTILVAACTPVTLGPYLVLPENEIESCESVTEIGHHSCILGGLPISETNKNMEGLTQNGYAIRLKEKVSWMDAILTAIGGFVASYRSSTYEYELCKPRGSLINQSQYTQKVDETGTAHLQALNQKRIEYLKQNLEKAGGKHLIRSDKNKVPGTGAMIAADLLDGMAQDSYFERVEILALNDEYIEFREGGKWERDRMPSQNISFARFYRASVPPGKGSKDCYHLMKMREVLEEAQTLPPVTTQKELVVQSILVTFVWTGLSKSAEKISSSSGSVGQLKKLIEDRDSSNATFAIIQDYRVRIPQVQTAWSQAWRQLKCQ